MEEPKHGLNLLQLMGLIIGAIVGAGVFNLNHDMAAGAGAGAIVISWIIAAIGMISLGLSFQNLINKRPDLNAGIYSYAEAGFGKYIGFTSAWGYWLSATFGNISYGALLMSAIGHFVPLFGDGQNIWSIIGGITILMLCQWMILRGVETASTVNMMITVAKIIPIFLFIVIAVLSFKLHIFTADFWSTPTGHFQWGAVMSQVKSTMLVTVWVFLGIEGAVIFSGRAKKRSDVGKATILGLLTVILLYALITLLSFGIMHRMQLANLNQPAMATLLASLVGKWGAAVINIGLIISVAGAWLSWTMFAAQLPYEASKVGTFPKFFNRENKNHAPTRSLYVTNVIVIILMFSYLVTPRAYNFFSQAASSAMLVPYVFASFYQFKFTFKHRELKDRGRNLLIGFVSSVYTCWLLYASGSYYLQLMALVFACGIPVFCYLQKVDNHKQHVFNRWELIIAICLALVGIHTIFKLFGF